MKSKIIHKNIYFFKFKKKKKNIYFFKFKKKNIFFKIDFEYFFFLVI